MTKQTLAVRLQASRRTVYIGFAIFLLLLAVALFIKGQTTIGWCTLAVACANATNATVLRRRGAQP